MLLPATREWLARAPLERRKRFGQFFTPEPVRAALLDGLHLPPRATILDPACGTGEFLHEAAKRWPDARLVGWEIDAELAAIARDQVPRAEIRRVDALREKASPSFDAVIGNPPYFEWRANAALRARYRAAISGRPNSYALFVHLGVELLREGGALAFVVPPSMNNGAYFASLRRHLVERCAVESIRVLRDHGLFEGAQQAVMCLRVRKGRGADGPHVLRRGPFILFVEDRAALERLFEGATTLGALGFEARTGSVVWNQVRERLTDDPRGAVRLVWSHDIARGRLVLARRPGKPAYVRGVAPLVGPAIVVNRITGTGSRATLRAAVVPRGAEFVAENHVNVVLPPAGASAAEIAAVAAALRSERSRDAARRLTGNTQISRTELLHLVPIAAPRAARRTSTRRRTRT